MAKIRVLIADDHAVLRAGIRLLINAQPDLEAVGDAADHEEVFAKMRSLGPDVLTLDLSMPGGNSLQMIKQLRQQFPQTRVLVLTMHDDPAFLRTALTAGASGYVVKTAADAELLTAIRAVHRGRTFVDLSLNDAKLRAVLGRQPTTSSGPAGLSPREVEVLGLLARGHTNQEIADRLFLSVKTIETHRARLMAKLDLKTRADLVRFATESGLFDPSAPA